MDYRDRLLRNDLRCLNDIVTEMSDELMLIRNFVQHKFGSEFNKFLQFHSNHGSIPNSKVTRVKSERKSKSSESDDESNQNHTQNDSSLASLSSRTSRRNRKKTQKRHPSASKTNKSSDSDSDENDIDNANDNNTSIEMFQLPCSPICTTVEVEDEVDDNYDELQLTEDDEYSWTTKKRKSSKKPCSDFQNFSDSEGIGDDSDPDFDLSDVIITGSKSTNKKRKRVNTKKMDRPSLASTCPVCDLVLPPSSKSFQDLQGHVDTHTEEDIKSKQVCSRCCKKWKSTDSYNKHVSDNKCHTSSGFKKAGAKQLSCRYCGKILGNRHKLEEHERIHTGEKPFSCEMCLLSFARKDNLARHLRKTHDRS